MRWWEWLLITAGGGGAVGAVGRAIYRYRRVAGAAVVRALGGSGSLNELRVILDEQRKGYTHLVGRVERLEDEVAVLNRLLAEARTREQGLERQLREERLASNDRISALHVELDEARARIAELEAQLARYRPDGLAPLMED